MLYSIILTFRALSLYELMIKNIFRVRDKIKAIGTITTNSHTFISSYVIPIKLAISYKSVTHQLNVTSIQYIPEFAMRPPHPILKVYLIKILGLSLTNLRQYL